MTVEISELCVSCLLGTFAYAVAHLLRAIAELFLFGYEVRYLRVRIASRVRCPAFLSSCLAWCLDLLTALLVSAAKQSEFNKPPIHVVFISVFSSDCRSFNRTAKAS